MSEVPGGYAYVKFIKPCNSRVKHKVNSIVSVSDILHFEKYEENKNREFKVNCGSTTCSAVIGITGSKYFNSFKKILITSFLFVSYFH